MIDKPFSPPANQTLHPAAQVRIDRQAENLIFEVAKAYRVPAALIVNPLAQFLFRATRHRRGLILIVSIPPQPS
jgi:hypothetical protein